MEGQSMKNFITYFRHSKSELDKVIFPTKIQVRQAFFAVFMVVTFVALFLALVDLVMSSSLSAILG
jgi:preprotein translocase subunit SecE